MFVCLAAAVLHKSGPLFSFDVCHQSYVTNIHRHDCLVCVCGGGGGWVYVSIGFSKQEFSTEAFARQVVVALLSPTLFSHVHY